MTTAKNPQMDWPTVTALAHRLNELLMRHQYGKSVMDAPANDSRYKHGEKLMNPEWLLAMESTVNLLCRQLALEDHGPMDFFPEAIEDSGHMMKARQLLAITSDLLTAVKHADILPVPPKTVPAPTHKS